MKLLVTGASGFIGRNFLLTAPKDWKITGIFFKAADFPDFIRLNNLENVTAERCNLIDPVCVNRFTKKAKGGFDAVLYLAANGDPSYSVINPLSDLNSNTSGLINVLENIQCKRFVYISSGAVYDGLKGAVSPSSKLISTLPYAISKMASERYVQFYQVRRKAIEEYVILRFFGAYGPYEPSRKIFSRLINAIFFEKKDEFLVRGNGKNYIDAMYVEDAVRGILSVLTSSEKNITVDFGCCNPLTLKELCLRVGECFGKNINVLFEGEVAEYITFYMAGDEMRRRFSFEAKISLEEGIKKFARHLERERGKA